MKNLSNKVKLIFTLFILIIIASSIFIINSSSIVAEEVTGAGTDSRGTYYSINTGIAAGKELFCTEEQYYKLKSGNAEEGIGRTDNIFIVIYKEKKFISSKPKVIDVKKYEDTLYEKLCLRIIPNKTYYRLIDEDYEWVTNKNGVFTRIYGVYRPEQNQMRLMTENIITPYFEDINLAKKWIEKNHKQKLQLKPLTIVDEKVMNKWDEEGYEPVVEYTKNSPKGLTYEDLIN